MSLRSSLSLFLIVSSVLVLSFFYVYIYILLFCVLLRVFVHIEDFFAPVWKLVEYLFIYGLGYFLFGLSIHFCSDVDAVYILIWVLLVSSSLLMTLFLLSSDMKKTTFNPVQYAAERSGYQRQYASPEYLKVPTSQYVVQASKTEPFAYSPLEQKIDADPLAIMTASKRELAWLKISLLVYQIQKRGRVHYENMLAVQRDEIACDDEISKLESMRDWSGVQEVSLNHLLRLERERREERASYFRDTARINKDLIDAVLEYKQILKRGEMLELL